MYVVPQQIPFPTVSGTGPQDQTVTVHMPAPVTQAAAILTGFDVEYAHGQDHHLGRLEIDLQVGAVNGTEVSVTARYGLRDWSGEWDDGYDGIVSFSVIGE